MFLRQRREVRKAGVILAASECMATILITGELPSDLTAVTRVAEELGHRTVLAVDEGECLRLAAELAPALVLLDVVVDGVDGFALCRTLKERPETGHIPVVILASKRSESEQFWARRQGADSLIAKPFLPEHLAAEIRRLVASSRPA